MRRLILAAAALALAACGRGETEPAAEPGSTTAASGEPESATATADQTTPPDIETTAIETLADSVAWPATTTRAKIITSKGDIVVELYPDKAPKTVANFVQYAKDGHYDRLIFHRVVAGFVIQGGGYNQHFAERPTRGTIPYEGDNGLKNYRTTVAMARTSDPNSATSQWFINLRNNNEALDHYTNDLGPRYGYTVFGRVIDGMDGADEIGALPTGAGGPFDAEVPVETATISRIDIIEP